jgi:hypothetical protein
MASKYKFENLTIDDFKIYSTLGLFLIYFKVQEHLVE